MFYANLCWARNGDDLEILVLGVRIIITVKSSRKYPDESSLETCPT